MFFAKSKLTSLDRNEISNFINSLQDKKKNNFGIPELENHKIGDDSKKFIDELSCKLSKTKLLEQKNFPFILKEAALETYSKLYPEFPDNELFQIQFKKYLNTNKSRDSMDITLRNFDTTITHLSMNIAASQTDYILYLEDKGITKDITLVDKTGQLITGSNINLQHIIKDEKFINADFLSNRINNHNNTNEQAEKALDEGKWALSLINTSIVRQRIEDELNKKIEDKSKPLGRQGK